MSDSHDPGDGWKAALLGGAVSAGIMLLVQFAYVRGQGGDWAALIRVGEHNRSRPYIEADLGQVPLAEGVGHDGQSMYLMARHIYTPAGRTILTECMDHVEYRARRILHPALAGGFGLLSPRATLFGLIAWSLAGAFLYGASIGMLGTQWRLSALTQCIALLNPGLISAGLILSCDALGLGLALLGAALWLRGWPALALAALAAAALTKDTFILFALVIALTEARAGRWRPALAVLAAAGLPLALWSGIVHLLFQQTVAQGSFNFAMIGMGLVRSLPVWRELVGEQQVQLYLALAMLGMGLVALPLARQPVVFGLLAMYVLLGLIVSQSVWQYPNNALRVLAPLWTFAALAIGGRLHSTEPCRSDQ